MYAAGRDRMILTIRNPESSRSVVLVRRIPYTVRAIVIARLFRYRSRESVPRAVLIALAFNVVNGCVTSTILEVFELECRRPLRRLRS